MNPTILAVTGNNFLPQAEESAPAYAEGKVRGREDESPGADEVEEAGGRG